MMKVLRAEGFDFCRDVVSVTVNRLPYGYAYEYIDLYDPPNWDPEKEPHLAARQPFGRLP